MKEMLNETSLDTIAAALCYAMGIEAPKEAHEKNRILSAYVDEALNGEKADRVLMYNPDAIAQWVYKRYPVQLRDMVNHTEVDVPLQTVMPSVTPVCFGTMYTGAQPEVHGIQAYEKPVITIDTVFDALIRAGKRAVIIGDTTCSLGKIYLNRAMDYFLYDTIEEITAKAVEVILEDAYDFVVVYHGNYDAVMHRFGPESREAIGELRANSGEFSMLSVLVEKHWKKHNTLVGFAMDHGCHEIDGNLGSHGLAMPEDLNIVHRYKVYPKENS